MTYLAYRELTAGESQSMIPMNSPQSCRSERIVAAAVRRVKVTKVSMDFFFHTNLGGTAGKLICDQPLVPNDNARGGRFFYGLT